MDPRLIEDLRPLLPNRVRVSVHRSGLLIAERVIYNLRTRTGLTQQASRMGSASGGPAKYIAVSSDATPPADTQTDLTGEITGSGLARAAGTYTAPILGTNSFYKLAKLFTATAAVNNVQKTALLDDAGPPGGGAAGNMWFVATFAAVSVIPNDTLTVEWQVTI